MKRGYERLGWREFGSHLLESLDLDPVYCALAKVPWDEEQKKRFCVAYWCHYHVGSACYAASFEGTDFWRVVMAATKNETPAPVGGRWQRGHERRHFRGKQGLTAVERLWKQYPFPEAMVDYVSFAHTSVVKPTCRDVMKRVQEHHLFGRWIGFKVADMLDRVFDKQVDFDGSEMLMFDEPRKASLMVWRAEQKMPETAHPRDEELAVKMVVAHLIKHFSGYVAPPAFDRRVGFQEVETILCKWKSHCNGHYPPWNDVDEINQGLEPWLEVSTAAKGFRANMPQRTA